MKKILMCALALSQWSWAECVGLRDSSLTVAILPIKDRMGISPALLEGMPDMIATELVQNTRVKVVERSQVNNALEAQKIEGKNLSEKERSAMAKWLGAKSFFMGSLTPLGNEIRLDLRLVSAQSGELLCASSATSTRGDVQNLVHQAMIPMQMEAQVTQEMISVPQKPMAQLNVQFKIVNSLFNESPIPVQKMRFYLDHELIGEGPILNKINQDVDLGNYSLPYGSHQLQIQVGSVDAKGNWKRALKDQPEELSLFVNSKNNSQVYCTEIVYDQGLRYKCSAN